MRTAVLWSVRFSTFSRSDHPCAAFATPNVLRRRTNDDWRFRGSRSSSRNCASTYSTVSDGTRAAPSIAAGSHGHVLRAGADRKLQKLAIVEAERVADRQPARRPPGEVAFEALGAR